MDEEQRWLVEPVEQHEKRLAERLNTLEQCGWRVRQVVPTTSTGLFLPNCYLILASRPAR